MQCFVIFREATYQIVVSCILFKMLLQRLLLGFWVLLAKPLQIPMFLELLKLVDWFYIGEIWWIYFSIMLIKIRINFTNLNRILFEYFFHWQICFLFLIWIHVLNILKSQSLESLTFFWIHLFFFCLFFFTSAAFSNGSHNIIFGINLFVVFCV